MDADMNEDRGAFPVDRPVEALLRDHNLVRQLAEAYRNSQSMDARREAASKIIPLVETHS